MKNYFLFPTWLIKSGITLFLFVFSFPLSAQQWVLDTIISTGAHTSGIAITPDNSKIVVTLNNSSGSVKVISTSTYATLGVITGLVSYSNGIAVRPPSGTTAIANGLNFPTYLDITGYSASGTSPAPCVATTLYDIAITPDGTKAVIPDLNSSCITQGLRVFDASGVSSTTTFIPVSTSGELFGIAIAPDGITAVVTGYNAGPKKVNLVSSVVQNIPGMSSSTGVAITNTTNQAVIASDSVQIVSLATNSIVATIPYVSNSNFHNVAITGDDKYAFVVGSFDIGIISLLGDTILETHPASGVNVACMSDGSKFFVTDSYNGTVRVYKKATTESSGKTQKNDESILIYPNPANDELNIKVSEDLYNSVTISNSTGQVLLTEQISKTQAKIKINWLPPGLYFVVLNGSDGCKTGSFIKK